MDTTKLKALFAELEKEFNLIAAKNERLLHHIDVYAKTEAKLNKEIDDLKTQMHLLKVSKAKDDKANEKKELLKKHEDGIDALMQDYQKSKTKK